MSVDIRVRFAPSPTGPLHIGGVRTALYNYLFAKKKGGKFILRIEDTDQKRYVDKAEQYIKDALSWCSISYDEGPGRNERYGSYRQSERKEIYAKYIDKLIGNGNAYYAFDTPEELELLKTKHKSTGSNFVYNWENREKNDVVNSLVLDKDDVRSRINSSKKYVVRFKTPRDKTLCLKDEIRGMIKIDTNTLDDKILFKSDGMPTYHFANVVDDHLMKISHVIRGEEWLPSLALHILLYKSFDWKVPKFAHLPLLLKPDGKGKLSKRDGDRLGFPVFPLTYTDKNTGKISKGFKEGGYFSDAFVNMLSLLGWNPGTEQEIFSMEDLINTFDLYKVHKSGSRFDPKKGIWFNQQYLQQKDSTELADLYKVELDGKKIKKPKEYIEKVVSLVKERAVFVSDFWELSHFFFEAPSSYDEKSIRKLWTTENRELMGGLVKIIESIENYTSSSIERAIKKWIEVKRINYGKIMQLLRLAIVGKMKGPQVFDIMQLINKEETQKRIKNLMYRLS